MLRINAYRYIQAAELLVKIHERIDLGWLNSTQPISGEAIQWINGTLPNLATHCEALDLRTTYQLIADFLNGYDVFASNPTPSTFVIQRGVQVPALLAPTRQEAAVQIQCIKKSFEAELQSKLFTFILPHRANFFSDQVIGSEIAQILGDMADFTDAHTDIKEAGNCFAAERFTATVYHLMRAAEYGLVSVAAAAGVPEDKRTSWDRLIQGIDSEIKKMVSNEPKRVDWREREKRYNALRATFISFQKGWRNPVSHIPRVYGEHTAKGMFSMICTLFVDLSRQGFKQSEMPKDPISLPEQEISSSQSARSPLA